MWGVLNPNVTQMRHISNRLTVSALRAPTPPACAGAAPGWPSSGAELPTSCWLPGGLLHMLLLAALFTT